MRYEEMKKSNRNGIYEPVGSLIVDLTLKPQYKIKRIYLYCIPRIWQKYRKDKFGRPDKEGTKYVRFHIINSVTSRICRGVNKILAA